MGSGESLDDRRELVEVTLGDAELLIGGTADFDRLAIPMRT